MAHVRVNRCPLRSGNWNEQKGWNQKVPQCIAN
jgi:hypothetical protein